MCRNIKKLRFDDRPPTKDELRLSALQFIRKISGYRAPSKAKAAAFDQAVEDVALASRRLFESITESKPN